MSYRLTQRAEADPAELGDRCRLLGEHPELGPLREDIAPGLRYLPVGRYPLLYRIVDDGVEIVRVVHGARHLPGLLA